MENHFSIIKTAHYFLVLEHQFLLFKIPTILHHKNMN